MSTWDIQAYAIFYDSNAFPECPDYIGGHYWPLQYLINFQWIVGSSYDRNQKVYRLYKLYHLSVIMKSHSSPKSATKCFINDPFFSRQKTWPKRTAFPFQGELHRKAYPLWCLLMPSEAFCLLNAQKAHMLLLEYYNSWTVIEKAFWSFSSLCFFIPHFFIQT